jgi:hypothetical protein
MAFPSESHHIVLSDIGVHIPLYTYVHMFCHVCNVCNVCTYVLHEISGGRIVCMNIFINSTCIHIHMYNMYIQSYRSRPAGHDLP